MFGAVILLSVARRRFERDRLCRRTTTLVTHQHHPFCHCCSLPPADKRSIVCPLRFDAQSVSRAPRNSIVEWIPWREVAVLRGHRCRRAVIATLNRPTEDTPRRGDVLGGWWFASRVPSLLSPLPRRPSRGDPRALSIARSGRYAIFLGSGRTWPSCAWCNRSGAELVG
jgi:hypothetical protein